MVAGMTTPDTTSGAIPGGAMTSAAMTSAAMTSRATIEIPVTDGTTLPAYVAGPARPASTIVIVAHELFGVTPQVRGVADELAAAGYLAIAPEYYHRTAPAGRWLERDAAGRQEGFSYLGQLERQQAVDDTAACVRWATAEHGRVKTGMIGFSAGGHLA
jgi:carboxymethylenebutenolidase